MNLLPFSYTQVVWVYIVVLYAEVVDYGARLLILNVTFAHLIIIAFHVVFAVYSYVVKMNTQKIL